MGDSDEGMNGMILIRDLLTALGLENQFLITPSLAVMDHMKGAWHLCLK